MKGPSHITCHATFLVRFYEFVIPVLVGQYSFRCLPGKWKQEYQKVKNKEERTSRDKNFHLVIQDPTKKITKKKKGYTYILQTVRMDGYLVGNVRAT